jgi:hypothetical protein
MTVKELIKELQRELRAGNGNLEIRQFCHDQNPKIHDQGDGPTASVNEYTNNMSETFIALST